MTLRNLIFNPVIDFNPVVGEKFKFKFFIQIASILQIFSWIIHRSFSRRECIQWWSFWEFFRRSYFQQFHFLFWQIYCTLLLFLQQHHDADFSRLLSCIMACRYNHWIYPCNSNSTLSSISKLKLWHHPQQPQQFRHPLRHPLRLLIFICIGNRKWQPLLLLKIK